MPGGLDTTGGDGIGRPAIKKALQQSPKDIASVRHAATAAGPRTLQQSCAVFPPGTTTIVVGKGTSGTLPARPTPWSHGPWDCSAQHFRNALHSPDPHGGLVEDTLASEGGARGSGHTSIKQPTNLQHRRKGYAASAEVANCHPDIAKTHTTEHGCGPVKGRRLHLRG